jgi:hypothetical protein
LGEQREIFGGTQLVVKQCAVPYHAKLSFCLQRIQWLTGILGIRVLNFATRGGCEQSGDAQ